MTDAMVWAYRQSQDDISLSMINSGGIRASFDEGNITMEDLLISFPFRNTFDLVMLLNTKFSSEELSNFRFAKFEITVADNNSRSDQNIILLLGEALTFLRLFMANYSINKGKKTT